MTLEYYEEGEGVFKQNDEGDKYYIVIKGKV